MHHWISWSLVVKNFCICFITVISILFSFPIMSILLWHQWFLPETAWKFFFLKLLGMNMREPDINSLFCSNVPVKPLNSGYSFWEMLSTELEDPEVLCLLETTKKLQLQYGNNMTACKIQTLMALILTVILSTCV